MNTLLKSANELIKCEHVYKIQTLNVSDLLKKEISRWSPLTFLQCELHL